MSFGKIYANLSFYQHRNTFNYSLIFFSTHKYVWLFLKKRIVYYLSFRVDYSQILGKKKRFYFKYLKKVINTRKKSFQFFIKSLLF